MAKTKEKPPFDLSRDFRERAERADSLSYRQLHLKITYHVPGFPHLLETRSHKIYDRMDIGLDDLVVARDILENPEMATFFMPYLGSRPAPQPVQGNLNDLKNQLRRIFHLSAAAGSWNESELKHLIERSDAEMDKRLDYLKDVKSRFSVDFFGRPDTDNIARLDALPETKFLPVLKQYFANWMYRPVANILKPDGEELPRQAQAPLNVAVVALETLDDPGDLRKARLYVDDRINQGRRVVVVADQTPKFMIRA